MEEKIRSYVNELFKNAPKNKKAQELKEEIYANLLDKYHELVEKGLDEAQAFENIKESVGDVSELIKSIEDEETKGKLYSEEEMNIIKKGSFFNALSVFLYIFSVAILIGLCVADEPGCGAVAFFVVIASASAIKYYDSKTYPLPKKEAHSEEDVQTNDSKKESRRKAWILAYWLVVVVLYFVGSFLSGLWLVSWIGFIIAAVVLKIILLATEQD